MSAAKKNSLNNFSFEKPKRPTSSPKTDEEKGLSMVLFRMSKEGKKQLDHLAIELGRRKQDILCEAVNEFFRRHDKQPIA